MAFDAAWKQAQANNTNKGLNEEATLSLVLESLKEHPFMIDSPSLAKQVGEFRVRLLNLSI